MSCKKYFGANFMWIFLRFFMQQIFIGIVLQIFMHENVVRKCLQFTECLMCNLFTFPRDSEILIKQLSLKVLCVEMVSPVNL